MTKVGNKTELIQCRLNSHDMAKVVAKAQAHGMSLAQWVRTLIVTCDFEIRTVMS